jgi:hypothetical protein
MELLLELESTLVPRTSGTAITFSLDVAQR